MGFIAKLFNAVPAAERKGISLDYRLPQWKVSKTSELPSFLRALADLVPDGSILYLEGGTPPPTLLTFLKERSVAEQAHVAMSTIWPRPMFFHLPATRENLCALADLAETCATPEAAIHMHVYHAGLVLLQWYDAFSDPFYISKVIPEDKVKAFCGRLSIQYATNQEGEPGDAVNRHSR